MVNGRPPAALHPGKTRYPLYRRLGGPQGHEAGSKVKVWELQKRKFIGGTEVSRREKKLRI